MGNGDHWAAIEKDSTEFIAEMLPKICSEGRLIGYYFSSKVQDALERNQQREGAARIPDKGVLGRAAQLELPTMAE